MGEPLSPDRVFDFPMNEPHPAYDFFAPAPLPEYAGNPNNNNGWLAANDYLLGWLEAIVDEQMVVPAVDEIAEQMVVPVVEEVIEPVVEAEEEHDEEYYDGTIQYETRSCSDVVAFACLILLSVTLLRCVLIEMLRTLRGNGPYGCKFDIMGLLCLKWNVLHVLKMISEVVLQALANHKNTLYGSLWRVLDGTSLKLVLERRKPVFLPLSGYDRLVIRAKKMPPRMTTRSAGWPAAASRRGGTGGQASRGGGRTRVDLVIGVGSQGRDQGDIRNVIENNDRRGCTYKEFLACNPKEYDGKGGDVVYTRWIEKIESV
ncbi:hypothetical protein Tco_0891178 [Tanacetum coccineum]|uniref:Uncharacterized protein n=1 Tax=Tanacetum coccineum TaxID=301880 RepID=A0ABQ5C5J6_9ASTR